MKLSLATLKNLDYKQLAIDHGEKFGLGLIGLFVLLALLGTRWGAYQRTPEELTRKVSQAETQLQNSTWPKEEQQKFLADNDLRQEAQRLLAGIEGDRFEYNTPMSWPLYQKEEPIREPDWLPVEKLVVGVDRCLLAEQKEEPGYGPDGSSPMGESTELAQNDQTPGPFRDRTGSEPSRQSKQGFKERSGSSTGAPGSGQLGTPTGQGGPPGAGNDAGSRLQESGNVPPGYGPGYSPDGSASGMEAEPEYKGRGARVVAVRGIYPLRKQAEELARATNVQLYSNVMDQIEVVDFELQRQTAVPGPDPWAGSWEPVDIEVARDVLERAESFDDDIVPSGSTDSVFTMPLPARIIRYWGDLATHPDLRRLTRQEMKKERLKNQKLLEKYRQQQKQRGVVRKGGFADKQYDVRDIQRQISSSSNVENFLQGMNRSYSQQFAEGGGPAGQAFTQSDLAVNSRHLLFRYFDFDVEPGNAYRYRVRLTVKNPNFGTPVDRLLNPEIAEGKTRKTEWSEPTPPAIVKEDVHSFLAEARRGRRRSPPTAEMNIYQWKPQYGTFVKGEQMPTEPGQMVGGTTTTYVLDPAQPSFEEQDGVELKTGETLVDVSAAPRLDESFHTELKLAGNRRNTLTLPHQALAVNEFGELVPLDTISQRQEEQRIQQVVQSERQHYAYLKDQQRQSENTGSGLDQYVPEMDPQGSSREEARRRRQFRDNPIRRRSARDGRSSRSRQRRAPRHYEC